jgi:hypothetical protein
MDWFAIMFLVCSFKEKSMVATLRKPAPDHFTFLKDLKLAIHETPTVEDKQAIELLNSLLAELRPGTSLDVVHWSYESDEYPLPWLRASHSLFYGLERIKSMAEQERQRAS